MISEVQQLILKLRGEGFDFKNRKSLESKIKLFNDFQMPISQRITQIATNDDMYKKFIEFLKDEETPKNDWVSAFDRFFF